MKKSKRIPNIIINIMFCLGSLVFILPFVLIISASFSDEQTLLSEGYKLIPSVFSTEAYKYVLKVSILLPIKKDEEQVLRVKKDSAPSRSECHHLTAPDICHQQYPGLA